MTGRQLISLIAAALAICALLPPTALAQTYPARPINVIVAFPPGGNTDIMARALQNEIGKVLGQTVVIINKAGAAGTLGLIELSRAAPDGYTLALTPNNPLTAQPHVQKLPYAMDSFRYVCLTYFAPYVLIAGPQAPFKTFDEFVGFAKAKRENLVYGHAGVASQPHLGMLAVLKAIGAEGLGVPFTGAGPMAQALLSGTVMAITGGRRGEQSSAPCDAVRDTHPGAPKRAHNEGIGLSDDIVYGRGLDRPATHVARSPCCAGNSMCGSNGARGVQNHRGTAQRRGALFAGRSFPQAIRGGFDGKCRGHQCRRPCFGQISARKKRRFCDGHHTGRGQGRACSSRRGAGACRKKTGRRLMVDVFAVAFLSVALGVPALILATVLGANLNLE